MANRFPYVASPGPLLKTIDQLRKSFPQNVSAATLKKLGLAPNNESYVINTLRFLKLIDGEGNKVDGAARAFLEHADAEFAEAFAPIVRAAYEELFLLHADGAWQLDKAQLVTYFRRADGSTETVGERQAGTFLTLAELAGHRERTPAKLSSNGNGEPAAKRRPRAGIRTVRPAATGASDGAQRPAPPVGAALGLSVRLEVNLPAVDDQSVYDKIFRSIRENLIDGR